MEAGLEALEEQGYAQATIDQVVAAAGASRATFYLHFKSKADLMQQLTKDHQQATLELYKEIPPPKAGREALRTWLDRLLTHVEHDRFLGVHLQAVTIEPALASAYEKTIDRIAELVTANQGASPELRLRARLLLLQFERVCFFWLVRGWDIDREELLEAFTDLWGSALQGGAKLASARTSKAAAR
jgi:AcrR family transcriptional regulator